MPEMTIPMMAMSRIMTLLRVNLVRLGHKSLELRRIQPQRRKERKEEGHFSKLVDTRVGRRGVEMI
jgi:hypothetical protein